MATWSVTFQTDTTIDGSLTVQATIQVRLRASTAKAAVEAARILANRVSLHVGQVARVQDRESFLSTAGLHLTLS